MKSYPEHAIPDFNKRTQHELWKLPEGKSTNHEQETITVTLVRRGDSFVWVRNDGRWVSPAFSSLEAAAYFPGKIPFLTDEEWKWFNPLSHICKCPQCGSEEIGPVHHEGSFAVPECNFMRCLDCSHQWGHS